MRILYIECDMGAAGDMLTGALSELVDQQKFLSLMNNLGRDDIHLAVGETVKCGIRGTSVKVTINGEEEGDNHRHHTHLEDINRIFAGLNLPAPVKENAVAVYNLIADAESRAHGMPVEHIHFHEVGTLDAVADVSAVCLLMDMIKPDRVIVSPVALGNGTVECAHGTLPVPAPAVARLCEGMPVYGGPHRGELLTPTGAALLKHFADAFGPMPAMVIEKTGYGMGGKDFPQANCVRVFLGEGQDDGDIVELVANIDDMTPEELAFAQERMMAAGAKDVYTIAFTGKKGRPGWLFTVMCDANDKERMLELMFKHTTTLGIRENTSRRFTMARHTVKESTSLGVIRHKFAHGYGSEKDKYEYDDLAKKAMEEDMSLFEVRKKIKEE